MMPNIRAGTEVLVTVDIFDNLLVPPALFTPNAGVKVTLHAPDGTTPVSEQDCTNTTTGHFYYQYQTTANSSPLGVWTTEFKVQHNSSVTLTAPAGGFVLVA
jgi:hypothetical protein